MNDAANGNGLASVAALPPVLTRIWWMPVAFVATVLLVLLCTPLIVNSRIATLRRDRLDVADEARVLVNDLEAGYVARLYARDVEAFDQVGRADSLAAVSLDEERREEPRLGYLVRKLGPPATRDFQRLTAQSHEWDLLLATTTSNVHSATSPSVSERGLNLLGAAETLDHDLLVVSTNARNTARQYEHADVIAAGILTPLALLAMCMAVWTGWRILTMARAIEREHAALMLSIDARNALIHGVTHDVKNPLGAAIGYAELLEDGMVGSITPDQSRTVQRIRHLIDVAVQTIAELLDVARADAGKLQIVAKDTNVASLLDELVGDYDAAAREKHIAMHRTPSDGALVVKTDAARVRRIVGNLLSNAIKYTPTGGEIRVEVIAATPPRVRQLDATSRQPTAHAIAIVIHDDGPGVPAQLRDRIFDAFFRAPGVEDGTDGSGMGLAISRRFAQAIGGDLTVDRSPLGGAAFSLLLPLEQ